MKKILVLLAVVVLFVLIAGGAVLFDQNQQNQKMRTIETRLALISDTIKSGNASSAQSMLNTTEMELTQLPDRWIAARKTVAKLEIDKLDNQIKSKGITFVPTHDLKKIGKELNESSKNK